MVNSQNIPTLYNIPNLIGQGSSYIYDVGDILDYLITLPTMKYYDDFCKSTGTMEFNFPKGEIHKISFVHWNLKFEDGLVFFCETDDVGNVINEKLIAEGKEIEGH